MDALQVRLYCTARVFKKTCAAPRTYWATEERYPYGRKRRDMVEIDRGQGRSGIGQLIAFVEMDVLPANARIRRLVIIRWLSPSPRSHQRDDCDRPLCDYPLSSNHCLWEWADSGRNRVSFTQRGFRRLVDRLQYWSHVSTQNRTAVINSEKRARYDVIEYSSIIRHANVALDPTTGHMLQSIQMQ